MDPLKTAAEIAEMLKDEDSRKQIAALEIAARILFESHHVKLVLEPV